MPRNPNLTVALVTASLAEFGLTTRPETVKSGDVVHNIEIVIVQDVELFHDAFGTEITRDSLDGTSLRVTFQRILRDGSDNNINFARNRAMQVDAQVAYLLGYRAKTTTAVFVALDKSRHATEEAALAASMAWMKTQA